MSELLVLKVGTSTLGYDSAPGQLHTERMQRLGHEIGGLVTAGCGVVLVSSGGRRFGWPEVYNAWQRAIPPPTANFLLNELSLHDIAAQETIFGAAARQQVPVANVDNYKLHPGSPFRNNDTVAAELAVRACGVYAPDQVQLGLLTDVDGVLDEAGQTIPSVDSDWSVVAHVGGSSSPFAEGGMITKVASARRVSALGMHAWIANGGEKDVLQNVYMQVNGTYFAPSAHTVYTDLR